MLRLTLTLYFVFMNTAGSWVCCCTVSRLADPCAGQKSDSGRSNHRKCCQHSTPEGKKEHGTPDRRPHKPCPCHEHRERDCLLTGTSQRLTESSEARGELLRHEAGFAIPLDDPFPTDHGSGRALLFDRPDPVHVFHILRC